MRIFISMIQYQTAHEVQDQSKVNSMVETLKSGGSLPPVYVFGIDAISGVHRLAAYEAAEMEPDVIEVDQDWMSRALALGEYDYHTDITDIEDLVEWLNETKEAE